jgi:AhpD family alkylhydroperoxidase
MARRRGKLGASEERASANVPARERQEAAMKYVLATLGLAALALATPQTARAQNAQKVPPFIQDTYPEQAITAAVTERQEVMRPGALDSKTKHLIALGVAAQIPCRYCVYFHTKAAKHAGATDAEIKEAIAAAALTRKWSTVLNGSDYDFAKMKVQVNSQFSGH